MGQSTSTIPLRRGAAFSAPTPGHPGGVFNHTLLVSTSTTNLYTNMSSPNSESTGDIKLANTIAVSPAIPTSTPQVVDLPTVRAGCGPYVLPPFVPPPMSHNGDGAVASSSSAPAPKPRPHKYSGSGEVKGTVHREDKCE